MLADTRPIQRPDDARLLVVNTHGAMTHQPRVSLADLLDARDLVVANDAATLPASLHGVHPRTGASIEVRLAGRASLRRDDVTFTAVVFGAGDFRTRTEDWPAPPTLQAGEQLQMGSLHATIETILDHPRLITLHFAGAIDAVWAGIAQHGHPIQYAHVQAPLELWDVWTPVAGGPVAYEPPSAGFVLNWELLRQLQSRGVGFATLTHAAGISSTGDPLLDRRLPLDEPYRIPATTAAAIRQAKARGGRIVAIGTTVVRALEHAAVGRGKVFGGSGVANQKIGPRTRLKIVDVLVSGTHEPDTSHYELLRAFASDDVLRIASRELNAHGYRTHEFGDSVWLERAAAVRHPRNRPAKASAFKAEPKWRGSPFRPQPV